MVMAPFGVDMEEELTNEEVEQAIKTIKKAKEVSDEKGNYDNMFTLDEAETILSVVFKD
jgi:hypothetical protein